MKSPVPLVGRILDALGVLVFAGGAGVYAWSWLQLRRLRDVQPESSSVDFPAVARANQLNDLSRTGLILMGVGAAVAILAAVVARLLRRREE